jgi:FkbM family methyltransferase
MVQIIHDLKKIINTENPVVVEIGCCEGKDSKTFLEIFEKIRLFCIEADPRNVELFKRYVGVDPRCKLFSTAISNKNGEITFYQSFGPRDQYLQGIGKVERQASGSVRKPKDHLRRHPWCKFNEGLTVPSITLDSWCDENNIDHIDLIWADVNGAEADMIAGAQNAFKFTRYLYTEFGPIGAEIYEGGITKRAILQLLPNFEEVLVNKNNVLLKNRSY